MLPEAAFATLAVAALTSLPVARRRGTYIPVAAFLWFAMLSDLARQQIIGRVVVPAKEAARAAGADPLGAVYPDHVIWFAQAEHALFMAGLAGAGAAAAIVFLRQDDRPGVPLRSVVAFALGWLGAVSSMVLSFPRIRGHLVELVFYVPTGSVSVLAALVSAASWKRRRLSVQLEHVAVGALAVVDLLVVLKFIVRSATWADLEVGASLVVYSGLVLLHGGWLWWTSSSPASSD